ncbi:MAG: ABC transporter ATP-binding protein [Thermoprotei archaeon]
MEIRNLSVAYKLGDKYYDAVRDVSFDVQNGESVALVGESGSGKSTVGLSVIGALPPNARIMSGSIRLDSFELANNVEVFRKIRWKKVSMVFQGSMNTLDPLFKVGVQMRELLEYHLGIKKEDAERIVVEALEKVSLRSSVMDLYPHELSGGMKQRVAIAMALLLKPKLLIADEPTTALDVTTQAEIINLLDSLIREEGMSMLFITHDLSLVPQLCDKIVVMYGGCVMEKGAVSSIIKKPLNPYTTALLDSMKVSRHHLSSGIPGDPPSLRAMPSGCPFSPRCSRAFNECSQTFPSEVEVEGRFVRCLLYNGHLESLASN